MLEKWGILRTSYNSDIEIFNKNITMTLKLNSETYSFSPQQKKKISVRHGSYGYRASAPSIIPSIGTENWQINVGYTWQFYIVTEGR